jgi:hypothetical protein
MTEITEALIKYFFPLISVKDAYTHRQKFDSTIQLGAALGAISAPLLFILGLYAFSPLTLGGFLTLFLNLGTIQGIVILYLIAKITIEMGQFFGFLLGYAVTVNNMEVQAAHRSDWQALKAALVYSLFGNLRLGPWLFSSQVDVRKNSLAKLDEFNLLRPSVRKRIFSILSDTTDAGNLHFPTAVSIQSLATHPFFASCFRDDQLAPLILQRISDRGILNQDNYVALLIKLTEFPQFFTTTNILARLTSLTPLTPTDISSIHSQIMALQMAGLLQTNTTIKITKLITESYICELNVRHFDTILNAAKRFNYLDDQNQLELDLVQNRAHAKKMANAIDVLQETKALTPSRLQWILKNPENSEAVARTYAISTQLEEKEVKEKKAADLEDLDENLTYCQKMSTAFVITENKERLSNSTSNIFPQADEKKSLSAQRHQMLFRLITTAHAEDRNGVTKFNLQSYQNILKSQEKFDLLLHCTSDILLKAQALDSDSLDCEWFSTENCQKILQNPDSVTAGFHRLSQVRKQDQHKYINLWEQPQKQKFFDLLINNAPHAQGIAELLAALYVIDHTPNQTQTDLRIRSLDIYFDFATNKPEQYVELLPYSSSIAVALASLHTLNSDRQPQLLFLEQEQLEYILNNPSKAAILTKAIKILENAGLTLGESGKSNLNHLIICLTSIDQIVEKLERNLTQGVFDDIIAECYQITFKEAGLNLGPALRTMESRRRW